MRALAAGSIATGALSALTGLTVTATAGDEAALISLFATSAVFGGATIAALGLWQARATAERAQVLGTLAGAVAGYAMVGLISLPAMYAVRSPVPLALANVLTGAALLAGTAAEIARAHRAGEITGRAPTVAEWTQGWTSAPAGPIATAAIAIEGMCALLFFSAAAPAGGILMEHPDIRMPTGDQFLSLTLLSILLAFAAGAAADGAVGSGGARAGRGARPSLALVAALFTLTVLLSAASGAVARRDIRAADAAAAIQGHPAPEGRPALPWSASFWALHAGMDLTAGATGAVTNSRLGRRRPMSGSCARETTRFNPASPD